MGIERTYLSISQKYYWNDMYKNISEYVASCAVSQKLVISKDFWRLAPNTNSIPLAPCLYRSCDLVKMPQSTSANNYILTLLDVFTKWPEAVYIKSKNAVDVALALYQIFLNMGFIRSDQGREFGKKIQKNWHLSSEYPLPTIHKQTGCSNDSIRPW